MNLWGFKADLSLRVLNRRLRSLLKPWNTCNNKRISLSRFSIFSWQFKKSLIRFLPNLERRCLHGFSLFPPSWFQIWPFFMKWHNTTWIKSMISNVTSGYILFERLTAFMIIQLFLQKYEKRGLRLSNVSGVFGVTTAHL